ncbi:ATP-binding protein [Haliangium sp.]
MARGLEPFVGRDEDLAALRAGVIEAREGHGGVWLVGGEPGIGKSRLAEELARDISGELCVAWGRCWEEGGAPPYWPWTQVLRTLVRKREIGDTPFTSAGRGPWLTQLVTELSDRVAAPPPALEPDVARFRLLDAVVGALCDAAERQPLLVILEDLHVADVSSVELLEFFARQIRATRVALVGTLREAEARRGPGHAVLARLVREARCLSLDRLGRDAVETYLVDALGRAPSASLVDAMLATTEGNPLFLSEIVRRQSGLERVEFGGGTPVIPHSVQIAIAERVAELAPATRELLETASALGREVSGRTLAEVSGVNRAALTAALAEAVDHAVLVEVAPDVFRFSHILVRETMHKALGAERGHELHRRMAIALERTGDVPWPQVAYHYLAAGASALDDAVAALRRAALQATEALAFTEAAAFYRQALALVEAAPADPSDPDQRDHERCELSLGLAAAARHAGELDEARRACDAAVTLARRLDDPELFAVAALESGGVLKIGAKSETLVDLLEQALERLRPGDSATRAQVMARLSAARQPAKSPEGPFELARRAIAMARRVGDDRVLLDTLHTGISTLMDLADPRERMALNEEHAALAEKLNAPLDALTAWGRLVFDAMELGKPGVVNASIAAYARIVDELDLSQRRWRLTLMRAMCATSEGRFDEAEALTATAAVEAECASDPWATCSVLLQRHLRARLRGEWERALELLDPLDPLLHRIEFGRNLATLLRAATLAAAGWREAASVLFADELVQWPLIIGDLSFIELVSEVALVTERRDVLERVVNRLRPELHRNISWGIMGATSHGPTSAMVGRLLVALGQEHDGEQHLREARARAQATGYTPHVAWIALWIARLPRAQDAAERAAEALQIAESLGMPGLAEQARAQIAKLEPEPGPASAPPALAAAPAPVPGVDYFQMRCEGGVWIFECDNRSFHLKDLKGLQLLSRLVAAPGRELHVLDLASPTGAATPETDGDAGEVIDAQAREAYRRRVEALREELAEAEQWNDLGRAETVRAELDAIAAELSRAVGLSGRSRRSASHVERARINVQRRLKDAIRRIEAEHPALGKHLSWAVRTGTYCCYQPK